MTRVEARQILASAPATPSPEQIALLKEAIKTLASKALGVPS